MGSIYLYYIVTPSFFSFLKSISFYNYKGMKFMFLNRGKQKENVLLDKPLITIQYISVQPLFVCPGILKCGFSFVAFFCLFL